jgi:predicted  nucleic acid-binding Zn-ribbon protein
MVTAMEVAGKGLDGFRSPMRVLARSFQRGRAKWKRKYLDLKQELQRLKVRVHDVNESRDQWKEQAQSRQRELAALQAELVELQRRLGDAEKKGPRTTAVAAS